MDIIQALKEELQIGRNQVEAAVKLIDEGNTIPFIARYRKEATGSLNDEVLRALDERLRYLRNLEEKKEQVLASIREQEKLTPELEKQILDAATLVAVERFIQAIPSQTENQGNCGKGEGIRAAGKFDPAPADKKSRWSMWLRITFQKRRECPQSRKPFRERRIFWQK